MSRLAGLLVGWLVMGKLAIVRPPSLVPSAMLSLRPPLAYELFMPAEEFLDLRRRHEKELCLPETLTDLGTFGLSPSGLSEASLNRALEP